MAYISDEDNINVPLSKEEKDAINRNPERALREGNDRIRKAVLSTVYNNPGARKSIGDNTYKRLGL